MNETQNKTIASDLSARLGMNYQVMEGLSVDLNGSLTYSPTIQRLGLPPGPIRLILTVLLPVQLVGNFRKSTITVI